MLKIKNKNSVPATPKSWKAPSGHKIRWDSVREPWETFVHNVMSYCDRNGIPRPSLEELEDMICRQMSGWACIGDKEYAARQSPPKAGPTYSGGCSGCGKRKTA